jgi:hypothetical protein
LTNHVSALVTVRVKVNVPSAGTVNSSPEMPLTSPFLSSSSCTPLPTSPATVPPIVYVAAAGGVLPLPQPVNAAASTNGAPENHVRQVVAIALSSILDRSDESLQVQGTR